ncbi:hypothetical protein [Mucilaginibacter terrae]|uniref:Uncharacterized protein n=1 Tax=Mucilaginibacter terrae TaxID=1955052 RepID=A0ABU3GS46_9SPHI|nr:hypothetical protein [Mucilaginibacter terrae]MDT3401465.1 hypothetical protein [Mucilaginibacter terrae]
MVNLTYIIIDISYAFEKEAEGNYDEIEAHIIANVDAATFEAEWQNVNYLYVIGNEAPKFKVSAVE